MMLSDSYHAVINRIYRSPFVRSKVHQNRILSLLFRMQFVANHEIDRKILRHFNFDGGYFVELGAYDGVSFSNTLHLELFKNWSGLLIEPSPHQHALAVHNRAKRTSVVNAACVENQYNYDSIELIYSGFMTIDTNTKIGGLNSTDHARLGKQFIEGEIYKFVVRAATLTEILDEVKAPIKIDFVSLDVEGSELNVLKGLNFQKYQVEYILIETRDLNQISNYLSTKGFQLIDKFSDQDFLFKAD
jgi:FkbM family methyltransferase